MGLQDVGHPSLPLREEIRQRRSDARAPHPVQELRARGRGSRPSVEQQHADLSAVEGLVQDREIRDHHREQPEAGGTRDDHDGSRPSGDVAAEPEREQRRSRDVDGVSERLATPPEPVHERGTPQDQGEAQQGEGHPTDQQREEEEGRRAGQDPLPGLGRLSAHADPSPRTPERREQEPTQARPAACRAWHDQGSEHVEQGPQEDHDARRERDPAHRCSLPGPIARSVPASFVRPGIPP